MHHGAGWFPSLPRWAWGHPHKRRGPARGKSSVPAALLQAATREPAQVLAGLASSAQGLAPGEVARRRGQFGANLVAHEDHETLLGQLRRRLLNPLNLLLLSLAAISLATGDRQAAVMIGLMVLLSLSLATFQERRSGNAAKQLRAMVHTTATVRRRVEGDAQSGEGRLSEIPIQELVPGDVVHISAGDLVPGDLRLIASKDLHVDEAALTGESLPVEKHADRVAQGASSFPAPGNICFMGTTVVSGTATGVIVLTGSHAYFGSLADLIVGEREPTSFDRGIERFAGLMIRFILVMAPIVFLINGLLKGDWVEALLFATAVAVGLTPEMLPMIVTMNLAKGALAMARRKVIVKRLNAIQNLGAMDVLCTDKTGTLTQNRVILERHVDLLGKESAEVLEYAYLNSAFQSGLKNLLDVAVLEHAQSEALAQRLQGCRKIDEVPFDFQRRRMSVAVQRDGQPLLICKGAVEEVFAASSRGRAGGESFALDATHLRALRDTSEALNAEGFRVIAVACKELPGDQSVCSVDDEKDLVLLGYIAFLDPPKDTARQSLAALAAHGVRVKVLTGDSGIVTRKICRDVGLAADRIVLGPELEGLDEGRLGELAEQADVFARISPAQKAALIAALQARGHVVGFLGDGINDGPALKAADVGVSVDTAVDIAKESADIILLEKSLLVLDQGVLEGRRVFGNIIKYIRMGASSNFGNMFSVIGASAWLPFLPMAPVQVLTNNLLYDVSQTAIPTDEVDAEYLDRPRRWDLGNIGRFMLCLGPISSIFDYATYFTMYYLIGARTLADAPLFQTGWFVESLLSQTLIIHVIRTRHVAFVESRASAPLMLTTLAVCGVGLWLPYSPFARALGLTSLPPLYWLALAPMLAGYFGLTHLMKLWFHRRFGFDT